jgi:protein-S-isoprenylcysteine O-methyltransferase Ste14
VRAATAQLLAALMTAAHGAIWVLASRWERPGRDARLRVRLQPPRLIGGGGDLAQVVPLLYPAFVVVAPGWGYDGWLNWSTAIDPLLQGIGLGLWAVGMAVLVWTARVLGRYMSVEGVTVDHELVSSGPYRYVRHPVSPEGFGDAYRTYTERTGRFLPRLRQARG